MCLVFFVTCTLLSGDARGHLRACVFFVTHWPLRPYLAPGPQLCLGAMGFLMLQHVWRTYFFWRVQQCCGFCVPECGPLAQAGHCPGLRRWPTAVPCSRQRMWPGLGTYVVHVLVHCILACAWQLAGALLPPPWLVGPACT